MVWDSYLGKRPMKIIFKYLAIIVTPLLIVTGCTQDIGMFKIKKEAFKAYKEYIYQQEIDSILFTGPVISIHNEKFIDFEWSSIIPIEGSIKITVCIDEKGNSTVCRSGSDTYWSWVAGSTGGNTDQKMLKQLLGMDIHSINTRLDSVVLTYEQKKNIAEFIQIKHSIIEFYFKMKRMPEDLEELNIEPWVIRDRQGYKYRYLSSGNGIILGAYGPDHKWAISDTKLKSMLIESDFGVEIVSDDIIVKFIVFNHK
jgi:hypothetical protein